MRHYRFVPDHSPGSAAPSSADLRPRMVGAKQPGGDGGSRLEAQGPMTMTAATRAELGRNLAAERASDVFAKLLFQGGEPVTITYEGLLREAGRFANFYASRGVRKQDVVLIILDHSPDVIYAHVG